MCVMPGSILSGYHHDPLRLERYRESVDSVDASVDTIWELPITTFKNKAVVLGGLKTNKKTEYPIVGRDYDEPDSYVECSYTLNKQGNRSAWTNKGENAEFLDVINSDPWEFNQGADIMPRTALFHEFTKLPNGTWSIMKIDNTSELYYLLSDSHKDVCRDLVAEGFSDAYMYDCLISKHLSPFMTATPAKVILPGKKIDGRWKGITDDEIALLNYIENRYIRINFPPVRAVAIYGESHYNLIGKLNNIRDLSISVVKTVDLKDLDYEKIDELFKDVDGVVTLDVHHENKKRIFKACYQRKMLIYDVPSITDMLLASSDILHIVDSPILKINKFGPSQIERIFKRLIDIVGSLILIVITSPIMLLVAAAIKIQDKGDVFYKQVRLTKDEKEFKIIKFRSMVMNAEKNTGVVLAKENDDRITPVGKFIRKTRLDELPQLLNILSGEMSFVGPRPERPEIYDEICKTMPEFRYRLVVKAGLTGYAQVYGKYNTSLRDKLLLDLYYIENYSIIDDIKLILLTLKIIFNKDATEGIKEEDGN